MPVLLEKDEVQETSTAVLQESVKVSELSRVLAKISGHGQLKPGQRFSVELSADGKKIYIRTIFDPREAGIKAIENLKGAEGGAWKGAELEKKFSLSPATLHRRRKEHRIIFWRDAKNDYHYPKWQFNENGALWEGIQDILQALQSDDEWRVMRYFLMPRKQLGNKSPLSLLRAGQKDGVIGHAKAHAEENTW